MEKWHAPKNVKYLAGVDEVGRGPLAGDVVTAAVILPAKHSIQGLDDSKVLTAHQRESLYKEIVEQALCFCVARASVAEIDQYNILQSTMMAMRRAVIGLEIKPDFVAVDGNRVPKWEYSSEAVIKGDGRVEVISAASIIAKVVRDREMVEFDAKYPGYGFANNKGYGTAQHMEALKRLGATSIHRRSFAPVSENLLPEQQSLL